MGILRSIGKGLVAIVGEARQDGQESEVKKRGRATANPFAVPLSNAERASLDCGNAEKRSALASGGVDVFGLSKEKIVSEAVALLNELCRQKLSSQNKPSSVKTDWANLTKTGKTPKKVAECYVIFDLKSGDSTICTSGTGATSSPTRRTSTYGGATSATTTSSGRSRVPWSFNTRLCTMLTRTSGRSSTKPAHSSLDPVRVILNSWLKARVVTMERLE